MSIRYKLTDQNMCTYNNTRWVLGIPKHTDSIGNLCSSGWLHCYNNPILAILLNPVHANIINPRLFKCEATGNHMYDKGLKEGCTTMVLIKEIPVPKITVTQLTAFGILCSLEVYTTKNYTIWAHNWLNNIDRTYKVAMDIAHVAIYVGEYAALDAMYAVMYAAMYAALDAALDAAHAAMYAAHAAMYAASKYANVNNNQIDFNTIIKKVLLNY